jgi:hypothetical protein
MLTDFDLAVCVQEDIVTLNVSMDDRPVVQVS